jgi:hypothetical protein
MRCRRDKLPDQVVQAVIKFWHERTKASPLQRDAILVRVTGDDRSGR